MCINIRLSYRMIAYSCFVIFLAYKNCKFKAGGGHECYCRTASGRYVVTMPTPHPRQHAAAARDITYLYAYK